MATNREYLAREHPVRAILEEASLGRRPTKAQLDAALSSAELPEGSDLGRFRRRIVSAVDEIIDVHGGERSAGLESNHGAARRLADDHVGALAGQMSDAERQVSGPTVAEPLEDIARRMFS